LVSPNPWLFQGLDESFDHTTDFSRQYLVFRNASDPLKFFEQPDPDLGRLARLWRYLRADGKPVRSLVNLLNYYRLNGRVVPDSIGDERSFQYASRINDVVRTQLTEPGEHLVIANYLDVHPPFDASDEALDRFAPDIDRDALPIGVPPERHIENEQKSYDLEWMQQLYRAAIWDLDRTITPLIRELVQDGVFVIVTSDHGLWNVDTAYDESRLHVPLLLFEPDRPPARIDHTVSLQSLPVTTMTALLGDDGGFPGEPLQHVVEDGMVVTEVIHHPNEVYDRTGRVDTTKAPDHDAPVQRDLVVRKGDGRVVYIDSTLSGSVGPEETIQELRAVAEDLLETSPRTGKRMETYNEAVEDRIKKRGYE
jgi:hypothetical protein